ncbi:hypothetical protein MHYP_G00072700 [Metynnis hypsauchen]
MTHRLFEEKHHASIYQKYRLTPPDNVKEIILQYLDKKVGQMFIHAFIKLGAASRYHVMCQTAFLHDHSLVLSVLPDLNHLSTDQDLHELNQHCRDNSKPCRKSPPHELAVDLGCGTGQNTRLFSPHFQKVVGIDVSENQLEVARAVPGFTNITYRVGTAEELPFPDGSVDLLTAASAAHWFDHERFLKEAARVLKPRGCMALLGYTSKFTLHYGSCGDRLDNIFSEVLKVLLPYYSSRISVADSKLQDLYEAIPFPDKERIENIPAKIQISVTGAVGLMESFSMYQTYLKKEPQAAAALLESARTRESVQPVHLNEPVRTNRFGRRHNGGDFVEISGNRGQKSETKLDRKGSYNGPALGWGSVCCR